MAMMERGSGLRIRMPAGFTVSSTLGAIRQRLRQRRPPRLRTDPEAGGSGSENAALLKALAEQELELLDAVELGPGELFRRRQRKPDREDVTFQVPVEEGEEGLLLMEQDGLYSWVYPSRRRRLQPGRRSNTRSKVLSFTLPLATSEEAVPRPNRRALSRRGLAGSFTAGRLRAFLLKLPIPPSTDHLMALLEERIRRGLVLLEPEVEATEWRRVASLADLPLPGDRSPRLLLFFHGTFSSTAGCFGALAASPWGQQFLAAAGAAYDAVLGFDHPTLSRDPRENASELLKCLEALGSPHPVLFDAVAFCRGGLVLRSFVEQVLPTSSWAARLERAAFVGTPHAGMALASPESWRGLADLHTNLAVAANRALAMDPQAKTAATVLEEAVQGLGAFVRYLAVDGGEGGVPGLAAMGPGGPFVTEINRRQPGQPGPANTFYGVVTSELDIELALARGRARELPRRLLRWLADGSLERLVGGPNDLMVGASSMVAVDLEVGDFIHDHLDFGRNPDVYHTAYFIREETVEALRRWLRLEQRGVASRPTVAGAVVGPELPVAADSDILVLEADAVTAAAREAIRELAPRHVVVRRPWRGETLTYSLDPGEILHTTRHRIRQPLAEALELREEDRSEEASLTGARGVPRWREQPLVIRDGDEPVAVVPGSRAIPDSRETAARATREHRRRSRESPPSPPGRQPTRSWAEPLDGNGGGPRPDPPIDPIDKGPEPEEGREPADRGPAGSDAETGVQTVLCHYAAAMDREVAVGVEVPVEVTLSRQALALAAGRATARGRARVRPGETIQLLVFPRSNFEVVGDFMREVEVPAAGQELTETFQVQATHPGDGEVQVILRQGSGAPVVLRLLATIHRREPPRAARVREVRSGDAAFEPEPAVPELRILRRERGPELFFEYHLALPEPAGLFERYQSEPLKVDLRAYVTALYQEIEALWSPYPEDRQAFADQLRAYGGDLFERLFPPKLQQRLWEHRGEIRCIRVVSEEPFIPWELVHLKEPGGALPEETLFLAQMGLVRWLFLRQGYRWPLRLPVRPDKIYAVVPDYPLEHHRLPAAPAELDYLTTTLGAKPLEPASSQAVKELLQQEGAFDLLHFTCHGEAADGGDLLSARLLMTGRLDDDEYHPDLLTDSLVRHFARFAGPGDPPPRRPLVVLNACQVGRAGYQLTGIGGFAEAFMGKGAGAFVGTLWSVTDEVALAFNQALYDQLLADEPLATAAVAAREAARKEGERRGDASWLAYAVYGHPQARLDRDPGEGG